MTRVHSRILTAALSLAMAAPAAAQTSWGVALTPAGDLFFCDARRDRVLKLDRHGELSVLLVDTHCRGLALATDGFVYGESVSAGTHIDASTGIAGDSALGVWRVGPSGPPQWVQSPTQAPDPSIWLVVDRLGRSYGWNGALPRSTISQIVRRDAPGITTPIAGGPWGRADGHGADARFGRIAGMALAPDDTLVVADSGNIRRVTLDGAVTTESTGTVSDSEAGLVGRLGLWDRTVGVATDADGSAVIVDYPAGRVLRVARDGRASELWRSGGFGNSITGSRWGWQPTGVAVVTTGFYVMEDWALPPLLADLAGSPRILLVKPDGSTTRVVAIASWPVRLFAILTLIIILSTIRPRRRRRAGAPGADRVGA